MRLATYKGSDGEGRSAVVVNRGGEDVVIDLNEASGGKLHHSLIHILREGDAALDEARRIAGSSAQGKPLSSVTLLAPLTAPGQADLHRRQLPEAHRRGRRAAGRQEHHRPQAVHQALVLDHRPGRGRDAAAGRRELDRLGARARGRHRQARPRHPVRAGARLRRRLLGDQRHQRPVDGLERRGAQPGRLRLLLRLAQRQVDRRLRRVGPVDHHHRRGPEPERPRHGAQGQRQGLAEGQHRGHDLQLLGDHLLRVPVHDLGAGRRHRRRARSTARATPRASTSRPATSSTARSATSARSSRR